MKRITLFSLIFFLTLTAFNPKGKCTPNGTKFFDINLVQNYNGVMISFNRIELSQNNAKVYVSISNETKQSIYFDATNARLIQGRKQYTPLSAADGWAPGPQAVILPGTVSEGSLFFPALDAASPAQLIISCHTEDYRPIITKFNFEMMNRKRGGNTSS